MAKKTRRVKRKQPSGLKLATLERLVRRQEFLIRALSASVQRVEERLDQSWI